MKKFYVISVISLVISIAALSITALSLNLLTTYHKKFSYVYRTPDSEYRYSRVDVSDIADTGKKVEKILKEFEGVNSYTHDNVLAKQIAEMGNDAVQPLLNQLDDLAPDKWAKKLAIENALERLLTKNHKKTILKIFKEKDVCSKLIKKYGFPEAEDTVMDKIKYSMHVDDDIIDVAIMLNKERAIPLLINYVSSSPSAVYAAQKLTAMPDINITETLKKAAMNARGVWSQSGIARLMIERGMKEGLGLAIQVLRNVEECFEYSKEHLANTLSVHTDAKGDYNEIAAWLENNKDALVWNKEYRRFK